MYFKTLILCKLYNRALPSWHCTRYPKHRPEIRIHIKLIYTCFGRQHLENSIIAYPWCLRNNYTLALTGTHYSCILRVWAGTSKVGAALATFCQVALCPCTTHTGIPGRTTSSSKESRPRSFNCSRVAQLTAHNYSINMVPAVITHSAPMAKEKDLNTTFQQSITSHQSNSPFCSCVIRCDI